MAWSVFAAAAFAGSFVDRPPAPALDGRTVIAGDFHVHAAPGDGVLPVWELQREAARRGLDVIAITNHNHDLARRVADASRALHPRPLVIYGQELTTPTFHIAAVGVMQMADRRRSLRDAIAEIHAQGGVAIAAHPVPDSWTDADAGALAMLDGVEVAQPAVRWSPDRSGDLLRFFETVRAANPRASPIGSSDAHAARPLGAARTYLLVDEVSEQAVLDAIRDGRTVAHGARGRLIGEPEHVAAVRAALEIRDPSELGQGPSRWLALAALLALAAVVAPDAGRRPFTRRRRS